MRRTAGKLITAAGLQLCSLALAAASLPIPDHARYVFQKVGEGAGLSTVTAGVLFQDHLGFIWIGTDHGLLRYDGFRVAKYGPEQGFPSANVEEIAETPDHRIVATAREYIGILQGSHFQRIVLPSAAHRFAAAQPFVILPNGHMYVATDQGLFLVSLEAEGSQLTSAAPVESGIEIQAVYAARDGRIWIAEADRIGWFYEHGLIHWIAKDAVLSAEPTMAVVQDGKGTVWIRTTRHLGRLDVGADRIRLDFPGLPTANDVGSPALDRAGRLMIPTVSGLFLNRGDHWDRVDSRRGAASNAVLSVLEDREGTYWIGYGGNGIERWQGERTWSGWTAADGLPDNVVWSEMRDRQGRLWVGTNNGVALWDKAVHRFRTWGADSGLNGSTAREIAIAPDGSIWVLCHPGGLTRFDPNTLRPQKIAFPGSDPITIAAGSNGNLWIAGQRYLKSIARTNGIYRFEDIPAPADITANTVSFAFAPDHGFWIAGRKGLAYFKNGTWKWLTTREGLASDRVVQVVAHSATEAWIKYGDAHGVSRIRIQGENVQVTGFDAAHGLQSDEVYLLGMDRSGNVWAGGPNGIASIAPDGLTRHYGHSDGLIWEDQSEGGFYAEPDGSLLFGTSGGLARFDPNAEHALPLSAPRVVFTSTTMGGQQRQDGFRASHRDNTLQATFAALSYRDPDNIRCRYRMNGLETDFTETTIRELRYPALPPGSYTLELSCKLPSGLTSQNATFSFNVLPAWWQTWWARGLAFTGILFGLYGVLRLHTYRLEKDRERLERAVAERSRELESANNELREAALTDPLTGTRNRRYFQMTIQADVNQTVRAYKDGKGEPVRKHDLIFYLIDADHFKQVNDVLGHDAGDELLKEMTRRISCAIRQSDILIRWGGEEFLVVSRYTQQSDAQALASRILNSIGGEPFLLTPARTPLYKTCSLGWAALPWLPHAPEALGADDIVTLADQALYAAKQGGRNRAVGFLPSSSTVPIVSKNAPATAERLGVRRIEVFGPPQNAGSAVTDRPDASLQARSGGASA